MKYYKIGEVKKILGIGADAIRYYEKRGLLKPVRSESGYRYFSIQDVNRLLSCSWLRAFGFSVEEVGNILALEDYREFYGYLDSLTEGFKDQIERLENLITMAERQKEDIQTIDMLLGKCELTNRTEHYQYFNRSGPLFEDTKEAFALGRQWQKYNPFARRIFQVPVQEIRNGSEKICANWGIDLDEKYAGFLKFTPEDPVRIIPAGLFIQSVISLDDERIIPKEFTYLLDFAREKDLNVTGDLTGQVLVEFNATENTQKRFYKIVLPVSKER